MKNFQIQHKLGSGSYGVIYKALNKSNKSICVLKQINLSRMNEKAKKNAVNQATVMGKLNHPFIVRYQDSFIEDRTLHIVMEYCDGGDLAYFLKLQNKKYLKEQKIWKLFLQICMGLEHIHKNKILHRDIKTLNIFLNKNQQVKIGDLGVAKILSNNDFAQTMVGTPFYLSPQLCQEKPYNQKSDIWALGCLLYELCTFRHPFQAANQASLILKIIRGKYLPIPQFYSKELKDMIDSCLERDYKRRPTASMILNKPRVKQLVQQFRFQEIVESENKKNSLNAPTQNIKKIQTKLEQKAPAKIDKPKQQPKIKEKQQIKAKPAQLPKPKIIEKPKQQKKLIKSPQIISNQPKPVKEIIVKQHQPLQDKKYLFGDKMPESKAQFISNLEKNVKEEAPRMQPKQVKKNLPTPTQFFIPWKDKQGISNKKSQQILKPQKSKVQDKVTIHSKGNILVSETPSLQQKKDMVHKVKVQKQVLPRVYESQKNMRNKGGIKSGGFSEEIQERKKSQIVSKIEDKKISEHKNKNSSNQKQIYKSEKNIKSDFSEKPSLLNKKRDSNFGVPHYPPRVRKNPRQQPEKVEVKKVPKAKGNTQSRYAQITKQQEDLVANLPDIVTKGERQSDSDDENTIDMNKKFKLNEINDDVVLKKYQEILDSRVKQSTKKQISSSDEEETVREEIRIPNQSMNVEITDENVEESQNFQEDSLQQEQQTKINYDEEQLYEINNFQMERNDISTRPTQPSNKHQWSYDQEPQLPMLQENQAPFFEEVNPYLVDERVEESEEEILEDKKQYLQIKLKENMKREDQINRLMQLKIQECRMMVSKGFEEILTFFRSKINMDKEYTEEDEREVENFLRKRNLTDHRKFQNIYKIMHFEMELENTRRIIQTICKRLNELEN